jgi:hypothetical protein
MPIIQDVLWKHPGHPGMIVVTCHSRLDNDGRLMMDFGEAKEAARRIPGIEQQAGLEISTSAMDGVYGFLPVRPPRPEDRIIGFGLFQVKVNSDETPDPELIKHSMTCLRRYAEMNASLKIRMNYPGIGEPGLDADQVAPLLLPLPKTVTLCHQGEIRPSLPASFPGFKTIYLEVERMLQEGRQDGAVEFLLKNGFDIQSATDQVSAVQRMLRERTEKEAERVRGWRQTHFSFYEGGARRTSTAGR